MSPASIGLSVNKQTTFDLREPLTAHLAGWGFYGRTEVLSFSPHNQLALAVVRALGHSKYLDACYKQQPSSVITSHLTYNISTIKAKSKTKKASTLQSTDNDFSEKTRGSTVSLSELKQNTNL